MNAKISAPYSNNCLKNRGTLLSRIKWSLRLPIDAIKNLDMFPMLTPSFAGANGTHIKGDPSFNKIPIMEMRGEISTSRITKNIKRLISKGNEALGEKDYGEAKMYFGQALVVNQCCVDALVGYGKAAMALGEFKKARDALNKAVKVDRYDLTIKVLFKQAQFDRIDLVQMKNDTPQKQYDTLVAYFKNKPANMDNFHALYRLGSICKTLKKFDESRKCYEKILQQRPDDTRSIYQLGKHHHSLGNFKEAEKYYDNIINILPNFVPAYLKKGQLAQANGRHDLAEDNYCKAIDLIPYHKESSAFFGLADIWKSRGDILKAEDLYNESLRTKPDNWNAMFELGMIAQSRGETARALSLYNKAIKVNPDAEKLYIKLGELYRTELRFSESKACYMKASSLDPYDYSTFNNLGFLENIEIRKNLINGDFERLNESICNATAMFTRAMGLHPNNQITLFGLGSIELIKGNIEQAYGYFDLIRQSAPSNIYALKGLAEIEMVKRDFENAKRYLKMIKDAAVISRFDISNYNFSNKAIELCSIYKIDPLNIQDGFDNNQKLGLKINNIVDLYMILDNILYKSVLDMNRELFVMVFPVCGVMR